MSDEKYLSVSLTESQTDDKVMAEVSLVKKPDDVEYDRAVLLIDNQPRGVFDSQDKLVFQTNEFGNVSCILSFYKEEVVVKEIITTLEMNISSWFAAAHPDLGHPLMFVGNGQNREIFSVQRARGSNDICFRMVIRVPLDEELTIYNVVVLQTDLRAKYNQALEVHYRGADYKDRNDLYTPPDEAMYHIDSETDKWQSSPITLGHGIHVLYVAPSCQHDLSSLVVTGYNDDFSFSFSGFFKTIL